MEFRERVRLARLVLVPEIRTAESRAMFGAMVGLAESTIQRIENDPGYNPGKPAIIVLETLIKQAGIEEIHESCIPCNYRNVACDGDESGLCPEWLCPAEARQPSKRKEDGTWNKNKRTKN